MRTGTVIKGATVLYLTLFFGYLFGPLFIMTVTAFNSSPFPRMSPWDCFTFEWFPRLAADSNIIDGLWTTLAIGIGVVIVSVSLGLAASLLLTQVPARARAGYYTIITTPILMPGVVLGIATYLFWNRIESLSGLGYGSFFTNGIFLTILGQSCFISSYCMLVMIARIQRFDNAQIEAALDLGASNVQAFRKVLLPFLRPAILSSAVIAFLASFENYNPTVFTISHYHTFTMAIAQKVRLGIDPTVSALATIIIVATITVAVFHQAFVRRGEMKLKRQLPVGGGVVKSLFWRNPAMVLGSMLVVAIAATFAVGSNYNASACKARLMKQRLEQQKILEEKVKSRMKARGEAVAPPPAATAPSGQKPGQNPLGNVFAPGNLEKTHGIEKKTPQKGSSGQKPGQNPLGNVFAPGNLKSTHGIEDKPAGQ